jgi:hypothetical protein
VGGIGDGGGNGSGGGGLGRGGRGAVEKDSSETVGIVPGWTQSVLSVRYGQMCAHTPSPMTMNEECTSSVDGRPS